MLRPRSALWGLVLVVGLLGSALCIGLGEHTRHDRVFGWVGYAPLSRQLAKLGALPPPAKATCHVTGNDVALSPSEVSCLVRWFSTNLVMGSGTGSATLVPTRSSHP